VIQDVEKVASRLKRKPFGGSELAAQRHIPLCGTESTQGVAS